MNKKSGGTKMKFTTDNTEGYSQEQLNRANKVFDFLENRLDKSNINYADECQNLSERILKSVERS
jgi:regulator of sigma D